jgi:pyruvate dehydrogenase E2 component (dihydrolipoamide acetyltransferase)
VPAAPATRRLARELGVDVNVVPATGRGGRVTPEDVQRAAAGEGAHVGSPTPTPGVVGLAGKQQTATAFAGGSIPYFELEPMPDFEQWGAVERLPVRSIRRKIARKMTTSKIVVPHVIHMDEADVTELQRLRREIKLESSDGPTPTLLAFVVKAAVAGLRRYPSFNASLDPDREEIVLKRYYNIGLAADTPRGLVVPVVKESDRLSITAISARIRELAGQAREGTLDVEDMRGGTFTITNVGPMGGIPLAPAINYPEVAIMGMGRVEAKPVVRDGEIVIRRMLPLTLSFDHRVADGADAARLMRYVAELLSDPRRLLLEV